jgi:predicted nucleic acid-binding protein
VDAVIDARPVISWINLVEVYYRLERIHGRRTADEALEDLKAALQPDVPTQTRMIEAARLKASSPIAFADAFALATAVAHGLSLLTGDPEILGLPDPPCQLEDLRAA